METQKYFKKKTNNKIVCQVCGCREFKTIAIMENEVRGRVISIDFSLHCKDNHVCYFKEYIKPVGDKT